ncbi:hypothetical protein SSU98_2183 [Streptococcus suis 98HAH33]|uniref:Uncharacterized protein n=1 Tax=Streptococcus suis (strain GZ1) TaxID=423211 RepID=D5AF43_STRGZ|nr:hypothetical protein SSU05_2185 [Streptococcus suis 05ZYH33]ABP93341.1 hypothetical protein SSU98_2183 [Streptococcus suis 98HAH33]ADE32436.1 hypothetical protein SSGZ1_1980 [Streptococcus suis GZ1]ADV71173.1 hypothetical protein SSUJS14_2130 [Streptococcus suis JS14]AER16274.1 hypothetical protein SSU12_2099 [Streptococcus suis SS12]AER22413.1 hypothetical protein SSUST1_2074 [Streptococcus suis ST1]AGL48909.1 hypothetical protein TL13_1987 [Streptococcus suis TL13]AGZ24304.1 hypothetica
MFVYTNHKLSKNYPLTTLLIDSYYNRKKLESQADKALTILSKLGIIEIAFITLTKENI